MMTLEQFSRAVGLPVETLHEHRRAGWLAMRDGAVEQDPSTYNPLLTYQQCVRWSIDNGTPVSHTGLTSQTHRWRESDGRHGLPSEIVSGRTMIRLADLKAYAQSASRLNFVEKLRAGGRHAVAMAARTTPTRPATKFDKIKELFLAGKRPLEIVAELAGSEFETTESYVRTVKKRIDGQASPLTVADKIRLLREAGVKPAVIAQVLECSPTEVSRAPKRASKRKEKA